MGAPLGPFPSGKKVGGAPFNVASSLNSLGAEVHFVSRVGVDPLGVEILEEVKSQGVSTELIQHDSSHETGKVLVHLDEKGVANYEIASDAAWDFIEVQAEAQEKVSQAAAFVYGSLVARANSLKTLKSFLKVAPFRVFDVNLRPPHYNLDILMDLMLQADLLKFNDEELYLLAESLGSPFHSMDQHIAFIAQKTNTPIVCVTKGKFGAEVFYHHGVVDFSIPPQWDGLNDMHFQALLKDGKLEGTLLSTEGKAHSFVGSPAPKLIRNTEISWGKPKALFDGKSLEGWYPSDAERTNQWKADDGILINPKSGVNLITEDNYTDFKLHIEFRYPKGSNSGIYLRGRYEVQVEDNYGRDPESTLFGGIYGFLTPNEMVAKQAGEWQTYDITLIGRRVSVVANGKKIITDQIIPGITGGALDSKEGNPGPIMLQGDHGVIEYRNITIQEPK